jgi:MFS family permease
MGLVLVFAPMNPASSGINLAVLAVVFVLAGIYVATEEALEDSLAAELVDKEHHGMGFGVLATVNGVGDFVSSIVVGALWTAWGTQVAFAYSTVLFAAGALAVWRLRNA